MSLVVRDAATYTKGTPGSKAPPSENKDKATRTDIGKIVNLMANDASKVCSARPFSSDSYGLLTIAGFWHGQQGI